MSKTAEVKPTSETTREAELSEPGVSRRRFIQGVMLASAAAAGLAGAVATTAGLPSGGNSVLTLDQERLLAWILDRLIPPDGAMPGAGELGVARFIDAALEKAPHLRISITGLLDSFASPDVLSGLSSVESEDTIRRLEKAQPAAFSLLLEATYTGYYSQPVVQSLLGWTDPLDLGYRIEPIEIASFTDARERSRLLAATRFAGTGIAGEGGKASVL